MDNYYVAYDDGEINDSIDFEDGTGPSCGPGETIRIVVRPQVLNSAGPIPQTVLLTLTVYGINGPETIQARAIPRNEVQTR